MCALPLAGLAPITQAAPPADCALHWQITPRLDDQPRHLQVDMDFDPGQRSRSTLRLPGGWLGVQEQAEAGTNAAQAAPPASPRLQSVPGAPALRSVAHASDQRVQLHWRLTPTADAAGNSSTRLTATWFALAGQGVLPVPDELDERSPLTTCVTLAGLGPRSVWASSHGLAEGETSTFMIPPGAAPLRLRVQQALYAGGALALQTHDASGQAVHVVMPADAPWGFGLDALAQASTQAVAAQRRYWGDRSAAAPMLLLWLPSRPHQTADAGSSAWHQALALQAPADLALQAPPDLALPGASAQSLLAQALASAWVQARFGPIVHAGRLDEAQRAWFSEGLADFLAHRTLLREGHWTAQDYASALNHKLALYLMSNERDADNARVAAGSARSDAARAGLSAARGEWLALQWHAALRAHGRPGLEATLQRLLVPAAQASREGPISAPLATHRLLAALRPVLGDGPMRDLSQHIDQGQPFRFGPATLGPCFVGQSDGAPAPALPRYQPIPQALQQPACLGWLGLGPEAGVAADSRQVARAGNAAKAGKATKTGKAKKTKPAAGRRAKHR